MGACSARESFDATKRSKLIDRGLKVSKERLVQERVRNLKILILGRVIMSWGDWGGRGGGGMMLAWCIWLTMTYAPMFVGSFPLTLMFSGDVIVIQGQGGKFG